MKVRVRMRTPGAMNKTEAAYALFLEARKRAGEIQWLAFEPIALALGTGAKYRPDFVCVMDDGTLEAHEVKGFMREAANVRIKVAAERYPWLRFVLVRKDRAGWQLEEIGA